MASAIKAPLVRDGGNAYLQTPCSNAKQKRNRANTLISQGARTAMRRGVQAKSPSPFMARAMHGNCLVRANGFRWSGRPGIAHITGGSQSRGHKKNTCHHVEIQIIKRQSAVLGMGTWLQKS